MFWIGLLVGVIFTIATMVCISAAIVGGRSERKRNDITNLQDELYNANTMIRTLRFQLEEKEQELFEADGYYLCIIDNLKDDIQELKQKLALETAALHGATKELAKIRKEASR